MSFASEAVGSFFDGIATLIASLMIAVIVFSGVGYLVGNHHGKSIGYEQGAKDALAGKISWQQTIKKDSVLIIKK